MERTRGATGRAARAGWVRAGIMLLALFALGLARPEREAAQANGELEPLAEPLVLQSVNGVLDATLVLDEGPATIGGLVVNGVWTYHVNGTPNYPGPTLQVQPGDTIRIRYVNQLAQETNLHTHGLHVSPLGNSDNVLLIIPPAAENHFEIQVPASHPNGLYWYHPHRHGVVDPQVYMGLSGLISIGSPDGGPTQLAGVKQRLMALQYTYTPGGTLVSDQNIPFNVTDQGLAFFTDLPNMNFTVNGQLNPRIDIAPGELQVWNFGNISNNGYFKIRIRGTDGTEAQPLVRIAQDGNPYTAPVIQPPGQPLLIPPGARFSLLVAGPPAGSYQLLMDYHNDGFFQWPPSFNGNYQQGHPLATIVSVGPDAPPPALPTVLSPPNNYFRPLSQRPVNYSRQAVFTISSTLQFLINGGAFPNNPVFQPRLNTVEQWTLVNASVAQHPFHIHVNDFQIQSQLDPSDPNNNITTPLPWFQDIVNLPFQGPPPSGTTNGQVVIRMNPLDFLGTYVYHCHRVDHEDAGMMALVTIIPQVPIFAVGLPTGGGGLVRVFDSLTNRVLTQFNAFPGTGGGVRVAVGDVNRDGVMDVATVPAVNGPAHVKVFSGASGFRTLLHNFVASSQRYRGGWNVAAGDLNSDGFDDVIVAPGQGGPPDVLVYSGKTGEPLGQLQAYESTFRGGVNLAAGILEDGGRVGLLTGPGPGRPSEIKVFNVDWYGEHGVAASCQCGTGCKCGSGGCGCGTCKCGSGGCKCGGCGCGGVKPRGIDGKGPLPFYLRATTLAYGSTFQGGVNVGTGIVDGQNGGFQSVLTGPMKGGPPLAKSFVLGSAPHGAGHGGQGQGSDGFTELAGVMAFPQNSRTGIAVAGVSTLQGAHLLVTPATGGPPVIRRFQFLTQQQRFQQMAQIPVGLFGGLSLSGK